jgi:hypothetical protein
MTEESGLVLDAIYNAAAAPDLWNVALDRLSGFFGCTVATLIDQNVRTSLGRGVAVELMRRVKPSFSPYGALGILSFRRYAK